MNALTNLSPAMFDIIRRMGREAVTATEMGVNGQVLTLLAERGFLLADRGRPTIYRLSEMGHGAHAVLMAPVRPKEMEGAVARIQRVVAGYYSLPPIEMVSERRARCVARPRQIAMYLCRLLTPHSYPTIGKKFGDRDHTTVLHAVRTVEGLRETDATIAADVQKLLTTLGGAQ